MKRPRTIAVVTGTRAEFGLLRTVIQAIEDHPKLQLRTIATGTHLSTGTWRDIRAAGFEIHRKVRMQCPGETTREADVAALARGIAGLGQAFAELSPDFVVVLGDRIEVLAAANAASIGGYRLAHLHGGDRAEGVADEAIRHATSKLAHLHFTGCASSRRRLIRMGETESLVFNHGSPAIDALMNVKPDDDGPDLIVMQHPIGESDAQEARWMRETLAATADISGLSKRLVFAPNHDPGRAGIVRAIGRKPHVTHLPREEFLAQLAGAKVIVGNSSAGLIEAAGLRTPCVNIGPRQSGREKPGSVIDCDYGREPVTRAIKRALKLDLRRMRHPYGNGTAGQRIAETLARIDLDAVPIRKQNTY